METLMELINECEKATYKSDIKKANNALTKAEELKDLGFDEASQTILDKAKRERNLHRINEFGYIKITRDKIGNFLKRKVEKYNEVHPKKKKDSERNEGDFVFNYTGTISLIAGDGISDDLLISPVLPVRAGQTIIFDPASLVDRVTTKKLREIETISENTIDYLSNDKNTIGRYAWTETPVERYKAVPPSHILEIFKEHKVRNLFDYFTIAAVEGIHDPLLLGRLEGIEERFFIAQWGDDIQLDDVI